MVDGDAVGYPVPDEAVTLPGTDPLKTAASHRVATGIPSGEPDRERQ